MDLRGSLTCPLSDHFRWGRYPRGLARGDKPDTLIALGGMSARSVKPRFSCHIEVSLDLTAPTRRDAHMFQDM